MSEKFHLALTVLTAFLIFGFIALGPIGSSKKRLNYLFAPSGSRLRLSLPTKNASLPQRRILCGIAGAVVWFLAPSWFTCACGCVMASIGPWALSLLEERTDRGFRIQCDRDLPLVLDLCVACMSSGVSLTQAVQQAGKAVSGPVGDQLQRIVDRLMLGADPVMAWRDLNATGNLQRVGTALARCTQSGALASPILQQLAQQLRMDRRRQGEANARKVAVQTAAPLGLCFLPAFVLLAIVPAVVASVGSLVS